MSSVYSGPVLELRNVSFRYPREGLIINDLSLDLKNGEFIGLLGANGSGKSTILKLAGGLLSPQQGEVRLWDKPLGKYPNRDRAKLLSYLPQHLDASVPFTVREIVGMGLYPYDIAPLISVDAALEMVGLAGKAESPVTNLSGGERRRVFIGMTLIQGAGMLLLDEPLANLDIKYQLEFLRLLHDLKERRNISIVMALHDINMALQFEKVILIKHGAVLGMGSPGSVLTPDTVKQAFDVDIDIKRHDSGEAYVRYGNVW